MNGGFEGGAGRCVEADGRPVTAMESSGKVYARECGWYRGSKMIQAFVPIGDGGFFYFTIFSFNQLEFPI